MFTTESSLSRFLPHKFPNQPTLSFPLTPNQTHNTVSNPILPNGTIVSNNTIENIVSNNTLPNGTIVSNSIVPNGNIELYNPVLNGNFVPNGNIALSNLVPNDNIVPNDNFVSNNPVSNGNFVPNGNIESYNLVLDDNTVSNDLKSPDHIVTCSIVDNSNLSFPSASIRSIIGIDFTFYSHLYFDL